MYIIETPFLDLDQIYNSRQCLRWIKIRDYKYVVPYRDKAIRLEQSGERLMVGTNDDEFYDTWFHYLDLQTDYMNINAKIKGIDEYIRICANRGNGMRVIKQDLFEILITYLVTNGDPHTTRFMVESIAKLCGRKRQVTVKDSGTFHWYEFPDAMTILENQDELTKCRLGKGLGRIVDMCQSIIDGQFDLCELEGYNYSCAKWYLLQYGIPETRAECICLFGLGHKEAFPLTQHIRQTIQDEFDDCGSEIFMEWYLNDIQEHAGILNQYLVYNKTNQPKEVPVWA